VQTCALPIFLLVATTLVAARVAVVFGFDTSVRTRILRSVGWLLVIEPPLRRTDVIVIGVAADGAGVLEAADLVAAGLSNRIAVVGDLPNPVDTEFERRGRSHYYTAIDESIDQLHSLG